MELFTSRCLIPSVKWLRLFKHVFLRLHENPYHYGRKIVFNFLLKVDEEQNLITELKKIEMRKKEREKKTLDLQKLITAADSNTESRRAERKATKKKLQQQQKNKDGTIKVRFGVDV